MPFPSCRLANPVHHLCRALLAETIETLQKAVGPALPKQVEAFSHAMLLFDLAETSSRNFTSSALPVAAETTSLLTLPPSFRPQLT